MRWKLFKLVKKVIPPLFTLDTHKLTRFNIWFVMFAERWTRKSTTSRIKKKFERK